MKNTINGTLGLQMVDIIENLEREIRKSKYANNLTRLSEDAGLRSGYLTKLFSTHKKSEPNPSAIGPGFFNIIKICELINITPNDLSGHNSDDPHTIDAMLDKYDYGGQRLEAFEDVMEIIDVYKQPLQDEKTLTLHHLGINSLVSEEFKKSGINLDKEKWQRFINLFKYLDFRSKIMNAYKDIEDTKIAISHEMLNLPIPQKRTRIKVEYFRLLLSVKNFKGQKFVICYSKEI